MRENRGKRILQGILLVLAVGMLLLGIRDYGMKDVWSKAVMICLECIGIG